MLIAQLAQDEAIAAADTLLLTVPNQLGVEYNAHVIESILRDVAPGARLALTGPRPARQPVPGRRRAPAVRGAAGYVIARLAGW